MKLHQKHTRDGEMMHLMTSTWRWPTRTEPGVVPPLPVGGGARGHAGTETWRSDVSRP